MTSSAAPADSPQSCPPHPSTASHSSHSKTTKRPKFTLPILNIHPPPPPQPAAASIFIPLKTPPPPSPSRRKFSFQISHDPSGGATLSSTINPTTTLSAGIIGSGTANTINNRRRFSNVVSDTVTRKLSTTIIGGWRRVPDEVVAVGRALCTLYCRSRLKRAGLFNRKLGLMRVRSIIEDLVPALSGGSSGSGSGGGYSGVVLRDVFANLSVACTELERLNPRLYSNIGRQTGVTPEAGGVGGLLAAIGHQLFRAEPSWGKVVAVFCVAGGLAVDCVRQGQPEQIGDLMEGMGELLEDKMAHWVSANGGWCGLNTHCRPEDQDISFVEYLGILGLVLFILLTAYVVVRFFVKFSLL